MKKRMTLLLCLALALTAGCSADRGAGSSRQDVPSGSEASSREDGEAEAADPAADAAVQELVDALAGYQPGTAGSSLKVYIAACGLLNYAEQYAPVDQEALGSRLRACLDSADAPVLESILQGQQDVQAAADSILEQGTQALEQELADAGHPNRYDRYDPEKYGQVLQVLTKVLAEYAAAE